MKPFARLALVLGLLLLAWGAMALSPAVREREDESPLKWTPSLAGWTSTDGAPEWALPVDPHHGMSARRTYARGAETAWVSVALFTGQHDPRRRAAINLIYPEKNTVRIDRVPLPLALNGAPSQALNVPAMVIQRGQDERLLVVYWHQIGSRVYASEYAYRLALTRDILLARRADSVLVRIGIPVSRGEATDRALRLASELAPALYASTARAGSGYRP